jgi:plasmid stabilization system protein ParE
MISIEWTTPAFNQLEALPQRLAFSIVKRVDRLAIFPEMGSILEGRSYGRLPYRKLVCGRSYVALYLFDVAQGQIWVMALQHFRQAIPSEEELSGPLNQ